MLTTLHKHATTNAKVRAAIQSSDAAGSVLVHDQATIRGIGLPTTGPTNQASDQPDTDYAPTVNPESPGGADHGGGRRPSRKA
jgi:hypothetical protein